MGTNPALRLRRSAAQLHALAQVEREIRATDPKGRCRYLRDFVRAFTTYDRVLSDDDLVKSLSSADILLIGDYHALPASQRYVTRLLEDLAHNDKRRPIVLALEAIFARHQVVLDEWKAGDIDEAELRERIRFDLDWGYDWQSYRELLEAGRTHAQAIYGLDCMPRSDLRRIAARDRHAATKLREIRERHPGARIVVLFGESHLAPTVYNLIDAFTRFLNIDRYSATNHAQPKFLVDQLPEVLCRASEEQLQRLLVRKGLEAAEVQGILDHVASRGACHVPALNAIFASSFQIEYGAEEAARFVHHACQGTLRRATRAEAARLAPEDRFYRRTLQEALAFFGSRVLYPARPPVRESDLYALYALPREAVEGVTIYSYREYMEMIDFLVLHKDYEVHARRYRQVPDLIRMGLRYGGDKFDFVTEKLGQILGNQLYEAYLAGRVAKRFLRSIFMRRLHRTAAAHDAYYAIVRKLAPATRRVV